MADLVQGWSFATPARCPADAEFGRCQFEQPTDSGSKRCENTGRKLVLSMPLGRVCVRFLCLEHSDWVEATEKKHG